MSKIEVEENPNEEIVLGTLGSNNEDDKKKNNIFFKILKVIGKFFLVILFPLWGPWKMLFVRSEDRKFKDMSTPIKVFRILRAPIVLPLKFCIFLLILSLELFIVYKIRYSPITYTITRSSVRSHYLVKSDKSLMGIINVNALELSKHYDEFSKAFDEIDKWDLDSKNKMYIILDADVTKYFIEYIDDETTSYVLNKFNTDKEFRENIKISVKSVNKILHNLADEIPDYLYEDELEKYFGISFKLINIVDYTQLLDLGKGFIKIIEKSPDITISETNPDDIDRDAIDVFTKIVAYYAKDHSLDQTQRYLEDLSKEYGKDYAGTNTIHASEENIIEGEEIQEEEPQE